MKPQDIFDRIIADGKLSDKRAGSLPEGVWPVSLRQPWKAHLRQYDLLASELAQSYADGRLPFPEADLIANVLWSDMIGRSFGYSESSELSDLLWRVFDAFDAGEWEYPGRFNDPVAQLTNPRVKEIVEGLLGTSENRGD